MKFTFFALALFCLGQSAEAQSRLHVSSSSSGGNGSSWSLAFSNIDDALAAAAAGGPKTIWVAAGVYSPELPTVPGDRRSVSYEPAPGVKLIGGFDGTETFLSQRAGLFEDTVMDGDIGVPGDASDNAYNLVRFMGNGVQHTLDGFTLRNANGNASSGLGRRGGAIDSVLGTKFVRNCIFEENYAMRGGAIATEASIFNLVDCQFRRNAAFWHGGALWVTQGVRSIGNRFYNNHAGLRGGAVYVNQLGSDIDGLTAARFQNNILSDNSSLRGGAIFVHDPPNVAPGRALLSGCTLEGNIAVLHGGAIGTNLSNGFPLQVKIYNSILWNNRSGNGIPMSGDPDHYVEVGHSIIQGGWPGVGILDADPLFVNSMQRDYRLGAGSPAIDAGDNSRIVADLSDIDMDSIFFVPTPFDADGNPRRFDDVLTADTGVGAAPVVDMGAFEYQGP